MVLLAVAYLCKHNVSDTVGNSDIIILIYFFIMLFISLFLSKPPKPYAFIDLPLKSSFISYILDTPILIESFVRQGGDTFDKAIYEGFDLLIYGVKASIDSFDEAIYEGFDLLKDGVKARIDSFDGTICKCASSSADFLQSKT